MKASYAKKTARQIVAFVVCIIASGAKAEPPRLASPEHVEVSKLSGSVYSKKQPALTFAGLRVVSSNGTQSQASNYGVYDFGMTSPLYNREAEHTFVLRNDSNAPMNNLRLHISQAISSGQAHPNLSEAGAHVYSETRKWEQASALAQNVRVLVAQSSRPRAAPLLVSADGLLPPLPPSQTLSLMVFSNLTDRNAEDVRDKLLVTMPGQPHPIAAVEVRGRLLPVVTFSSSFVNFGKVPVGQARVATLNLDINPRLVPAGSLPKLYCSNPQIHISSLPVREKDRRKSPLLNKEQRAAGLYAYLLTLSDTAPVGPVSGTLSIAYIQPPPAPTSLAPLTGNVSKVPVTPLPSAMVADVLRTASVQISGRVVGDVDAMPDSITFGLIAQGKEAVQRVQLSAMDTKTLQGVQINSTVPWLSAHLIALADPSVHALLPSAKARCALDVILSPDTPAGRLQTQMTLTLQNGQRLVLPVSALVQPRKGKP